MIGNNQIRPIGDLLREWRTRRHLSQLDLACEAEISARHLSFLETGRSQPSREMVLHLAEQLQVPLRERNSLLIAAGYAPIFSEKTLDDPTLRGARKVIDLILKGHEPFPALAIDRHWTLVASNRTVPFFLKCCLDPSLLSPPINVLRLTLHPNGLASRIANLSQWRAHLLGRLRRQIEVSADPVLEDLLKELSSYSIQNDNETQSDIDYAGVAVPYQVMTSDGILSFLSTTTVFGTPVDITLSEIALESFFPADTTTSDHLIRIFKQTGSA
jgi:transcriptional regulator with XRE-family HTH domain